MRKVRLLFVPFVALLLARSPTAQEPHRFTSRSDLVVLQVTVLDPRSGVVPGLPREAFTVYEDGKPREIQFFENQERPVTVGLVLDSSVSMQRKRPGLIAAGAKFAESSRPDDEMFTIHFNENVWPGLPPGKSFTSDREEIKRALERTTARGQTALFDAIAVALKVLGTGQRQKKALIVVSDGGDNASRTRFDDVLATALRMDAVIYSISITDQYDRGEANPQVLRKLAAATGGEAFFLRDADQAAQALDRIARDIRTAYTICYAPGAAEGYRSIRVDVRPRDRRRLSVRARSGYVAGGGQ